MYRCLATNEIGSLSHSAKINVIGPPFVRLMKDIAAVEGDVLVVRCPVAGYPVEEVYWEKSKSSLFCMHLYAKGLLLF